MTFPLEFTGERVIPGMVDPNLMLEHLSRYQFACLFSAGRQALDLACGTGYGASLMAQNARTVLGLDVAQEAVDYAREHFHAENLTYQRGDCRATGLADASMELITAFEIIEHLDQPEFLLEEIRRLLAPSGTLLISTPNRSVSEEFRSEPNPFHVREFRSEEFENLLCRFFRHVQLGGQNHSEGVLIHFPRLAFNAHDNMPPSSPESGSDVNSAHYLIAVCSELRLKTGWANPFFVASSLGNLLLDRDRHRKLLQEEIDGCRTRVSELEGTLEERNSHLALIQDQLQGLRNRLNEVEDSLDERDAHLQISLTAGEQLKSRMRDLEKELRHRDAHLQISLTAGEQLQSRVTDLERELHRRNAHLGIAQSEIRGFTERIADLEATLAQRDRHLALFQAESQQLQARIAELEGVLKERESHLALAFGEIQGLRNRLSQVEATIQERESHLQLALAESSARSTRIAELVQELESKGNHVRLLLEDTEAQKGHIRNLQSDMEDRGAHVRLLLEERASQSLRIDNLSLENARLRALVGRIKSTRLFKLASALPFLKGYLKRMSQA